MAQRELYLQWTTNRKSHMVYRTAPFSMTLNDPPNLVLEVMLFFDTEYLTNGYRYGHGYYRRQIGNSTQAFEWVDHTRLTIRRAIGR